MLRRSLAFAAAASLAASPVLAQSSAVPSADPLSVERSGAAAEGSSDLRVGADWFPALLFATIVVLGVLTATGVLFDDDPDSP